LIRRFQRFTATAHLRKDDRLVVLWSLDTTLLKLDHD
jgi:hypothetical protein